MFGIDKILHFLFYGSLALVLGLIACQLSPRRKSWLRLMGVGGALLWIGVLDEYRQFLDPHRDTEFMDGVANLAGVCAGLSVPFIWSSVSINPERISRIIVLPVVSVWLLLFFGLHILTAKGTSGDFFQDKSTMEGRIQAVIQTNQRQRGVSLLREKYLSQLLYVEQEYHQELKTLITYMLNGQDVLHHLWLMKQLDEITNDEFGRILQDMKKTVVFERLPDELLNQIEGEIMQRKRMARAKIIKKEIIHWRQQSYGLLQSESWFLGDVVVDIPHESYRY